MLGRSSAPESGIDLSSEMSIYNSRCAPATEYSITSIASEDACYSNARGLSQVSSREFRQRPSRYKHSVLEMLTDEARQACAIVPNYAPSNTIAEVYVATAIAILNVNGNPKLLVNISARESEHGLPT